MRRPTACYGRGEFAQVPRTGDTVFGFAAGLYPTDYPTLPDPVDESTNRPPKGKPGPAKRKPHPPTR
jgi:hypothetical protein